MSLELNCVCLRVLFYLSIDPVLGILKIVFVKFSVTEGFKLYIWNKCFLKGLVWKVKQIPPKYIFSSCCVVGMAVVIFNIIRQCEDFLKNLANGILLYLYQVRYFKRWSCYCYHLENAFKENFWEKFLC